MRATLLCDVGAIEEGEQVELVSRLAGASESSLAQGPSSPPSAVYVVRDDAGHVEQVEAGELVPELPCGAEPRTLARLRARRVAVAATRRRA